MRNDGRLANGMRKVKITPGFIKYAAGSCLIESGNTKVVCTANVEDGVPMFLKGKGSGWITGEYGMLPGSCQKRVPREATKGKKAGRTYEIQRLLGRSMRCVCDLTAMGERTLWIDCDVIQADGGTRCASVTGGFIAMYLAFRSMLDKGTIKKNPVNNFVAAVSVGIVDDGPCLDLTYEEDSRAQVDGNIIMTDSGEFVEVQFTAEKAPLDGEKLDNMLELAQKGIDSLVKTQKEVLKGA